jgi:hypothetical protein
MQPQEYQLPNDAQPQPGEVFQYRYRSIHHNFPWSKRIGDWSDVVAEFSTHEFTPCGSTCTGKTCPHKRGQAVSFASLNRNTARALSNVDRNWVATLDIDKITPEQLSAILAALQRAGISAVCSSTHSHKPDSPRVRLLIRLSEPVSGAAWPIVFAALNSHFKLGADEAAKDASRLFFTPTCPEGSTPFVRVIEGEPLDVRQLLAEAPAEIFKPRPPLADDEWSRMVRTVGEGGRNDTLAKVAGLLFRRLENTPGLAVELLRALNEARCVPPLPAAEVETICSSILRRELANGAQRGEVVL